MEILFAVTDTLCQHLTLDLNTSLRNRIYLFLLIQVEGQYRVNTAWKQASSHLELFFFLLFFQKAESLLFCHSLVDSCFFFCWLNRLWNCCWFSCHYLDILSRARVRTIYIIGAVLDIGHLYVYLPWRWSSQNLEMCNFS